MGNFIMDLQELKKIAPALDADLKAVFAKHGLTWAGRNASLNPGNGELSYKIKLATTAGGTDDIVRGDFKCFAFMFELKPEWLDATVKMNHENYRVAGLYPKTAQVPGAHGARQRQKAHAVPRRGRRAPHERGDQVTWRRSRTHPT